MSEESEEGEGDNGREKHYGLGREESGAERLRKWLPFLGEA